MLATMPVAVRTATASIAFRLFLLYCTAKCGQEVLQGSTKACSFCQSDDREILCPNTQLRNARCCFQSPFVYFLSHPIVFAMTARSHSPTLSLSLSVLSLPPSLPPSPCPPLKLPRHNLEEPEATQIEEDETDVEEQEDFSSHEYEEAEDEEARLKRSINFQISAVLVSSGIN